MHLPKVIERSAAVAKTGRVRDCAGDVLLGAGGSLGQRTSGSQARSDSRRERTSGAVGVARVNARHRMLVKRVGIENDILRHCA